MLTQITATGLAAVATDPHRRGAAVRRPTARGLCHRGVLSDYGTNENVGNGLGEPIAIIGMSCRLPGSAIDPLNFWDMLVAGRTAWTPGPGKRFNMKAFRDPTAKKDNGETHENLNAPG